MCLLSRITSLDKAHLAPSYVPFVMGGECVGQVEKRLVPVLGAGFESKPTKNGETCRPFVESPENVLRLAEDYDTCNERRSVAMDMAVECLIKVGELKRRHGELYNISESWGSQTLAVVDRNAAPIFGVTSVGVHLNCYVKGGDQRPVGVWMAQRAELKPNGSPTAWPLRWDPTVAGGVPTGLELQEAVVKEASEEAGIEDPLLLGQMRSAGVLSQMTADPSGQKLKQSLYFCWDLEVGGDFRPNAADGEVAQFALWTISELEDEVRRGERLRPAMVLVLCDFLIRNGLITPDSEPAYPEIISAMHRDRLKLTADVKSNA